MDKKSTHETLLEAACQKLQSQISPHYYAIALQFIDGYARALKGAFDQAIPNLLLFLQLAEEQFKHPYRFEPYHKKVRHPIDYYTFSLDFIRPLIDLSRSSLLGESHLDTLSKALARKENVILLANHQTEPDPQAISILLEKKYPHLAETMIFVAGARVVTDPLAIPFSMGCDLLCIYSKRYINSPPEGKEAKRLHNKKTMEQMSRLLKEGGKIIYVAPSGGRDRKNQQGVIEVAPFDPASVEMFYLMAKKAKRPTLFVPLALSTYELLPPPETIQIELGELRTTNRTPIAISFAKPFDMEHFEETEEPNKLKKREIRAQRLWAIVNAMHTTLVQS